MGRCNFGCQTNKAGKFVPMIQVTVGDNSFEFFSDIEFKEIDDARKFATAVYMALTGEQHNLRYDKNGNANLN